MAAPTRTEAQREHDRAEIARRYLRGGLQVDIAAALGMTQQMVSYDLQILQQRWMQASAAHFSAVKARELARIDHLELTYWQAWEASTRAKEKTRTEKKSHETTSQMTARVEREDQNGDPRFLQGVQWCIERRCKIMGIDAIERSDMGLNEAIERELALLATRSKAGVPGEAAPDQPGAGV